MKNKNDIPEKISKKSLSKYKRKPKKKKTEGRKKEEVEHLNFINSEREELL